MKIAAMIARYLLGLMFFIFGLNMFLNFIPMGSMPAGVARSGSASSLQSKRHIAARALVPARPICNGEHGRNR